MNACGPPPSQPTSKTTVETEEQKEKEAEILVNRYLINKSMTEDAGKLFNTKTLFVWQPVPIYKYNAEYHLFRLEEFQSWAKYTYPLLKKIADTETLSNFLWAADIQENFKEPLYVDSSHYNSKLNTILAEYIATFIEAKGLLN